MITVRPATLDDAADLLAWRNDPGTRAASVNDTPVAWDDHIAWLTRTLASPDRRLLILELTGRPAATARFDYENPTEFSFTIAPVFRHKGHSSQLMRAAVEIESAFIAHVRAINVPCQRLLSAAGMQLLRDGEMHCGSIVRFQLHPFALKLWNYGITVTVYLYLRGRWLRTSSKFSLPPPISGWAAS